MKECIVDKTPCLHAPCNESNDVACCAACRFLDECTTACFKAKRKEAE